MKHGYQVQTVLERGVYVRLERGGGELAWVRTQVDFVLMTQNAGIVGLVMCERVIS